MEEDTEYWLNIFIPILMVVAMISTLVILWKYNIEVSPEKIDKFLNLFKRRRNSETCQLIETSASTESVASFSQGASQAGQHTGQTCTILPTGGQDGQKMYGAIPKHLPHTAKR